MKSSSQKKALRVLLVDDHAVVRDGLRKIISEGREALFGEASTEHEALLAVAGGSWDVVVLDISIGDHSGLSTLQEIARIAPKLPVLILTMHAEGQYARHAFRLGACGYITKGASRAEILAAVAKAVEGGRYVSPALAEDLVADLQRGREGPPHAALSVRELEVMQLLGSGKTVTEIAETLTLSDRTVSTYRARILEKLGMKSTAEIVRYVVANHLENPAR